MKWTAALCATMLVAFSYASPDADVDMSALHGLGDVSRHVFPARTLERDLQVYVRVPTDYDEDAGARYPTVYLLDGGITFPLLASYSHYLGLGDEVPAVILVGIAYGTDDWRQGNLRSTDFTAPSEEREYWGGAARFQTTLKKELLPFIEKRYRSDSSRRILFGQSLGGQFVLFSAQTDPGLFWGHIASNPALHRNLEFFLDEPPATSASSVFVSSGSHDEARFRKPALQWMEYWQARPDKPWRLETTTLEGHSHFSAAPAAFRAGMRWLFE